MTKLSNSAKLTIQFALGLFVILCGIVLLFLGFYAVPIGSITPSVLTAFGEMATFSGALIGVDYNYKYRMFKTEEEYRHREDNASVKQEEYEDIWEEENK